MCGGVSNSLPWWFPLAASIQKEGGSQKESGRTEQCLLCGLELSDPQVDQAICSNGPILEARGKLASSSAPMLKGIDHSSPPTELVRLQLLVVTEFLHEGSCCSLLSWMGRQDRVRWDRGFRPPHREELLF